MEIQLSCDETGLPVGFTVVTGRGIMGGFGNPDELVRAAITAGMAYWKLGRIVEGDLYVRVGIEVGRMVQAHLSPRMSQIVGELREELAA
jgi:class 3 adenylate cyclase